MFLSCINKKSDSGYVYFHSIQTHLPCSRAPNVKKAPNLGAKIRVICPLSPIDKAIVGP